MVILGYTFTEDQIVDYILFYGGHLLSAVLIWVIGVVGAKIVRAVLVRIMRRAHQDAILINFISKIVYGLMLIVVAIAALNRLGVQTTSLVAMIGAAGLAIGLALQGSLSNFAAGIMIIVLKHFRQGDIISTSTVTGVVDDMNIFTTTLHTFSNERVIVPNSMLTSNVLTNISAHKQRRIDLIIGVGYSDDLDKVSEVLRDIIAAEPRILPKPAPDISIEALADSSVNIGFKVWVKTSDWGNTRSTLLKAIKLRFDAEGISIPSPQRETQLSFSEDAKALLNSKRLIVEQVPVKPKDVKPKAETPAAKKPAAKRIPAKK